MQQGDSMGLLSQGPICFTSAFYSWLIASLFWGVIFGRLAHSIDRVLIDGVNPKESWNESMSGLNMSTFQVALQSVGCTKRMGSVAFKRQINLLRKPGLHAFCLGHTWKARHTCAFWERVEPTQAKMRA